MGTRAQSAIVLQLSKGVVAYNIVELAQQLSVKEEISSRGELVCDGVEEDFWAVIFVLLGGALLALDSHKA